MDFGRHIRPEAASAHLPDDDPANGPLLARLSAFDKASADATGFNAYVGCPTWSNKEWLGKVYPKGTKAAAYLEHYSRQFNTIELNSTYYAIPDAATVRRWRETVPRHFRFCPKVPSALSHTLRLNQAHGELGAFFASVMGFEHTLGMAFLQMPPDFDASHSDLLERFLKACPRELPLAVELRHPSWLSGPRLRPRTREILEAHGATALHIDTLGRRDVLHPSLTSRRAMIRFLGNDGHPVDASRIGEWAARLALWKQSGLKEVYWFLHGPEALAAAELSNQAVRAVNAACGTQLETWRPAAPVAPMHDTLF